MIRRLPLITAPLAVSLLSAAALAADQAHGNEKPEAIQGLSQGLATGITALVVFFAVLAVLSFKVWPTISKGLAERADKIKSEIEAAEAARAQAKAALEQYEASLANARLEAQKEIDKARAAAQAIAAEMKIKNEADIQVMKGKALAEIEAAKRLALSEVYTQSASLATTVAAKILKREVTRDDQLNLVKEALTELKAV